MKVTSISYSRVFSIPDYENEKISITADIEENEKVEEEMEKLKATVEMCHKQFTKERIENEERKNKINALETQIAMLKSDYLPF